MKLGKAIAVCTLAVILASACAPHDPGLSARAAPVWKVYQDVNGRFSFEYPAAYDAPAYRDLCAPRAAEDGARVGMRSEIVFLESAGASLAEAAERLARDKEWTEESRTDATIDGHPALTLEYRFGGLNRYGALTLTSAGDQLLAFGFSAGAMCDIPEAGMTELKAFQRARASFRFAH